MTGSKAARRYVFLAALVLFVALLACGPRPTETPPPQEPPTATTAPPSAPTSTDTPPPAPTATDTAEPKAPTATSTTSAPQPTSTTAPPPAPTNTSTPEAPDELAILSFTIDMEDMAEGKRLHCEWETTGATKAMIVSGTQQRFPLTWDVPANGSQVIELSSTHYRDPLITLVAIDEADNRVSEVVQLDWPCKYEYFFPSQLPLCPAQAPQETWAAQQSFQNGRMLWLEEVGSGTWTTRVILVLYDDHRCEQYTDTWSEDQPESDPSITPPDGLLQPIRGFGKVWRENATVRDRLGWALSPEQGFTTVWQTPIHETLGGTGFVRTLGGDIIRINGWGMASSSWEYASY